MEAGTMPAGAGFGGDGAALAAAAAPAPAPAAAPAPPPLGAAPGGELPLAEGGELPLAEGDYDLITVPLAVFQQAVACVRSADAAAGGAGGAHLTAINQWLSPSGGDDGSGGLAGGPGGSGGLGGAQIPPPQLPGLHAPLPPAPPLLPLPPPLAHPYPPGGLHLYGSGVLPPGLGLGGLAPRKPALRRKKTRTGRAEGDGAITEVPEALALPFDVLALVAQGEWSRQLEEAVEAKDLVLPWPVLRRLRKRPGRPSRSYVRQYDLSRRQAGLPPDSDSEGDGARAGGYLGAPYGGGMLV
ncbi:hypothetical protein Rsub_11840 [Raphidocelis subcapitata]|uniref:Uncharacterized protein n=1 Tax=Raphidocelis subcapitata TaxID=307507 RepID=A0A2V0PHL4_9CHLO|nr:hypothetical protein Rsub_11840 [Raphidocelis subcapitata]|eukprot:GBF99069.1 hypothetical protein Rsub_11840 [Raphidocelis subcapitata]